MASVRCKGYFEKVERGKALVDAAANGDYFQVLSLLNAGIPINAAEYNKSLFYASKNYRTPLQIAASNGHAECVKLLIDRGADLNAKDRFDATAVHLAADCGHHNCLKLLLDAGAECCTPTKYSKKGCYTASPYPGGTTPLHLAAAHSYVECVKELIQYGADYNAVDERGRTSLYIAAEAGYADCVLTLLRNAVGKDILSLPGLETGNTPLHFCVKHGMVECVSELLDHGSDVNHRNYARFSPLHFAVSYNPDTKHVAKEILRLLVLKGHDVDINQPDPSGLSPLHYVCFCDGGRQQRRPELAVFLIAYGAEVTITNQRGYSLIRVEFQTFEDCTILKAINRSMLHLPSLSSLNISPPPEPESPPCPQTVARISNVQYENSWRAPPNRAQIPSSVLVSSLPDFHHHQRRNHEWEKYLWYTSIVSSPRSLQHYCRYAIRSTLGPKRLRFAKNLPIPKLLQQYILLEFDR
ncbi:serine/threonine-protein phosphatase 6 regulatory ankyrin repeat subunit B-like [Centruroides sculpturatus]|uniref:serine/threonine-protein phosphatase 6 regulatory ankyrin repeat subunit B-like n=1 Tax=Centruroides sculpturatus TaxID=218467 RepID=UPI000C6D7005|nr:serine/threonine-protein phosphatase 6 regulatory ankyrin repeat subunit B-like [Centruroides sculpturatus]